MAEKVFYLAISASQLHLNSSLYSNPLLEACGRCVRIKKAEGQTLALELNSFLETHFFSLSSHHKMRQ